MFKKKEKKGGHHRVLSTSTCACCCNFDEKEDFGFAFQLMECLITNSSGELLTGLVLIRSKKKLYF
jgi:hypothetical protein